MMGLHRLEFGVDGALKLLQQARGLCRNLALYELHRIESRGQCGCPPGLYDVTIVEWTVVACALVPAVELAPVPSVSISFTTRFSHCRSVR